MKLDRIIAVRTRKTVYRDGDKVIKVFDSDYSKADILNEAHNQSLVEDIGLNVPKVVEVTKIDDKWAIAFEYIEGKTIAQIIKENPSKTDVYMEKFVALQLSVHDKKCAGLNKLKDKMNSKISKADLDATTRYDLHTRLESMPKHNKVCHGDFDFSNVVETENGELFILDWAHVTQGNASADAARTYLRFWLSGDIKSAEIYLDMFCKKSDKAKQYVQKWLPIVAASQLVKGNEKEREFLLSWVNVVDYE